MHSDTQTLLNNFDETAYVFVNLFYSEFCFSMRHVDRLKDENTAQLWIRQYMSRLKQSLDGKALEYIHSNRNIPTIDWFQKKLTYMIHLHLQEFSHRVQFV